MNNEKPHQCISSQESKDKTKSNIEKFGLQVILVGSTTYLPSFAYSIGLWETYRHPEVICFGLANDLGHAIINDVAEFIKAGEEFKIGKTYSEIFKDSSASFLQVDHRNIGDYFGAVLNHYGSNHLRRSSLFGQTEMIDFRGKTTSKRNSFSFSLFLIETLILSLQNLTI